MDMAKAASTAEFAIGTFFEVWLCQNDYHSRTAERELMAFWVWRFELFDLSNRLM